MKINLSRLPKSQIIALNQLGICIQLPFKKKLEMD